MAIKRKTAARKPRTARRSSSTTVMRTQTTRRPVPVRHKRRVTRKKGKRLSPAGLRQKGKILVLTINSVIVV